MRVGAGRGRGGALGRCWRWIRRLLLLGLLLGDDAGGDAAQGQREVGGAGRAVERVS